MLRALIWIEWCSTWWWWLLILLPYAATEQLQLLTGSSTTSFDTMWMAPLIVGLGIASGMRDRQGSRGSLSRHGAPWQILFAKLLVPGVMMPLYDLVGLLISHDATSHSLNFDMNWYNPHDWKYGPAMLIPLFIAGIATGLRQARWWGTRLAPLIAMVTLLELDLALLPWRWVMASQWIDMYNHLREVVSVIAVLASLPALVWSLVSLRAAQGEDGPSTRVPAAWSVGIAMLGLAMSPWVYLSERWEDLIVHPDQRRTATGQVKDVEPMLPPFSLWRLLVVNPSYTIAPTGIDAYYYVRLSDTTRLALHGTPPTMGVEHVNAHARYTDDPVIIQGTGDADGPTTLSQAWSQLHLGFRFGGFREQWRHLRVNTGYERSCRFAQLGELEQDDAKGDRFNRTIWSIADDPVFVTATAHQARRLFQLDSWSGPELVLRPLTAADPPLLYHRDDLHVGIWADHLSWAYGDHAATTLPYPFPADTDAAIDIHDHAPVTWVTYHWRATPWSALRWAIDVVGHDGAVLSHTDVPSADDSLLLEGLSLFGSPAVSALGLAINRSDVLATNRPWSSPVDFPWTLGGACLAVAASWWLLARRQVPVRSRWGWLLAALAGGLAVPLAACAVWHPMTRRSCPSCNRLRWADDSHCPVCGAGWGRPAATGHEVSDIPATRPMVAAVADHSG